MDSKGLHSVSVSVSGLCDFTGVLVVVVVVAVLWVQICLFKKKN